MNKRLKKKKIKFAKPSLSIEIRDSVAIPERHLEVPIINIDKLCGYTIGVDLAASSDYTCYNNCLIGKEDRNCIECKSNED